MVENQGHKKVVAIVQARMGSQRLPGKTLMDICGKSLLEHIIQRIKRAKLIDRIVIATTTNSEDDVIVELANRLSVWVFRGSVSDVLDRYYRCAIEYDAEIIVRITADDPFKDPFILDKVLRVFIENDCDYVSNTLKPTYPLGLDVEVFSFKALEKMWQKARSSEEREHVTLFIENHLEDFKVTNVENDSDFSYLRWTLDTIQDLEFTRTIYKSLYNDGEIFLMEDILYLLKNNPEVEKINN